MDKIFKVVRQTNARKRKKDENTTKREVVKVQTKTQQSQFE